VIVRTVAKGDSRWWKGRKKERDRRDKNASLSCRINKANMPGREIDGEVHKDPAYGQTARVPRRIIETISSQWDTPHDTFVYRWTRDYAGVRLGEGGMRKLMGKKIWGATRGWGHAY